MTNRFFAGHAVVLSRVIDEATDGAAIFAGGFFLFENYFRPDGGNRVVEVYHAIGLFCTDLFSVKLSPRLPN